MGRNNRDSLDGELPSSNSLLQTLSELFFAVNVCLSLGYGMLFYYFSRLLGDVRSTEDSFDFCYYFLRSAARVKDLLHLTDPTTWSGPSIPNIAVAFLITAMCVSMVLFLFFRLVAGTPSFRVLVYVTGAAALFAIPAQLVYFSVVNRNGTQWNPGVVPSILFSSFGALVGLVSLISLERTLKVLIVLSLDVLFPGIAGAVLFGATVRELPESAGNYLSWVYMVLVIAALSWIVSSIRKRSHETSNIEMPERPPLRNAMKICVGIVCAILFFLWAPGRNYSLLGAKSRKSIRIELFRSACFGSCPIYTITVLGNGEVDYLGQMFVKECGKRSDLITEGQVTDILRELDRAHFFALEDRAFLRPPDVPGVSVTVSADGKTKRVWAVTYGAVPRNGAWAAFARAASRIDEIVGSAKWIHPGSSCEHRDGRPPSN